MTDETRAAVDKACAAAEASIEMLRDEVKRLREKVLDAVNAFDCRTSLNCWQEDDIGEYVVTAKSVHDFVAETRKLLAAPESRPAAAWKMCNGSGCAGGTRFEAEAALNRRSPSPGSSPPGEAPAFTRETVFAWIVDRTSQYSNSSGYRAFVDELLDGIQQGEVEAAFRHGELDGLLRPPAGKEPGSR